LYLEKKCLLLSEKKSMKETGDWIYFILLAIAVVSSIYKSITKARNPSGGTTAPPVPSPSPSFESDELTDDAQTPLLQSDVTSEKRRAARIEARRLRLRALEQPKMPRSLESGEAYSSLMKHEKEVTPLLIDEEAESDMSVVLPTEIAGWREAFIYSEVFRRESAVSFMALEP